MTPQQDTSTASTSWLEHKVLEHIKQALRVTLDWKVAGRQHAAQALQFAVYDEVVSPPLGTRHDD